MEYSIIYSARLAAGTSIAVGDVAIPDEDAPTYYVKATTAERGSRRSHAIALTAWAGSSPGAVKMQQTGYVAASVTGLGAGSASWVRCSSAGRLERFTPSAGGASDVVGYADALGGVALSFGVLTDDIVSSESGAAADTCTLEQFGAVGDGVTSDQTAIDEAFAALAAGTYRTLRLGAKTYLGTWGKAVPGGCSIIGQGHSSVLKQSGATAAVLAIGAVNDITLRDFKILGDGTATTEAYGVKMGLVGASSSGPQRVTLDNILIQNCWAGGVYYLGNPKTNYAGPVFINCRAKSCGNHGFRFAEEGEYATLIGCKADGCTYGITVGAGNITAVGCDFTANQYGVDIVAGANDAHGIFSGCNINHNTYADVRAGAIIYGHTFVGCHMYGAGIRLTSSVGVTFSDCVIAATALSFDGSTGTRFLDCVFPTVPTVTDNANGNASSTQWLNCRDLSGAIPAFIGQRTHKRYTFPSDANQTLSIQDSRADVLEILAGVLTATRTITLAVAPNQGARIQVANRTAQTVNIGWSSGSAVSVAAGKSALVGADGTNAVRLSLGDV